MGNWRGLELSNATTVLVALGGEEPHQRWRDNPGKSYYDGSRSKVPRCGFRGGVVPPASPYLCGLGLAKLASSTAACGSPC